MNKFDKVAESYDDFMKFWKLYREDKILNILKLKKSDLVIDIGGGTGHIAKHLSNYCKEIYVLDESKKMLDKIENSDKIKRYQRDALNTHFKNNFFDVIILSDVFHHIKEQSKLIDEMIRILKINGKILIHDFDLKNIKTKILRFFETLIFGRLYYRTSEYIEKLFIKKKLKLKDKIKEGYYFIEVWEKNYNEDK